ncbi:T9SS type A sorting domain-containing protein [Calditrichota bacterium]
MQIRLFLSVVLPIIVISSGYAQPYIDWSETYGGGGHETASDFVYTSDGNFAIGGISSSFQDGYNELWFLLINKWGDELISNSYGGEGDDQCNVIIELAEGGYALGGLTYSFGEGSGDFWLLVIAENGDSLWAESYGGRESDHIKSLIQTDDGGFIMSGQTQSFGAGGNDIWVVKTDDEGAIEWDETYGGDGHEYGGDMLAVEDGFVILGTTNSEGAGRGDMWLIKIDEEGNVDWSQTYGGSGDDRGQKLIPIDGGYALAGYTGSYGNGQTDYYLVITDEDGQEQLSEAYGGEANEFANGLTQTIDGGYCLVCQTTSFGEGSYDFWVVKVDAEGEMQWSTTYGNSNLNRPEGGVFQWRNGSFYIFGNTDLGEGNGRDLWVIQTTGDPDLPLKWLPIESWHQLEDIGKVFTPSPWIDYLINPGIPDSSITFDFENSLNLSGEIQENGSFRLSLREDWNGVDSLGMIVSAPDQANDTTYLTVIVKPVNDLPESFSLVSPADEANVSSWMTSFQWQEAAQNEWELDSVLYNLHFNCLDEGYESAYIVTGLSDTMYSNYSMTDLSDSLGLELGLQEWCIDWWVVALDDSGEIQSSETYYFTIPVESVGDGDVIQPHEFAIEAAYPNPFNSSLVIDYSLRSSGKINLLVFDLVGRNVGTLYEGKAVVGRHRIAWQPEGLATGVYWLVLRSKEGMLTRKVLYMK